MSDISIIVCGHNEGRLLHRTLHSIFDSVDYAKSKKELKIEVILSLDNPSKETLDYLESSEFTKKINIYKNNFEDVALSRNFAVKKTEGKYIAFIDGDDLMCSNWIYDTYNLAESIGDKRDQIFHPEYLINFEGKSLIWKRLSTGNPNFRYGTMMYANCWDLTCFMPKSLAAKFPFEPCSRDSGWGMEDYHFFLETLGNGVEHIVVPRTVVFIRVKSTGSRLSQHVTNHSIVQKTKFFEPEILGKYILATNLDKDFVQKKSIYELLINFKHFLLKPFPNLHLFLYRVKLSFLRKKKATFWRFVTQSYPKWLLEEWKSMNKTEPSVFPSIQTLLEITEYNLNYSDDLARDYLMFSNRVGNNVKHLILVPFIKIGGAEKVLFNFIKSLQSLFPRERIIVVSTEPFDSPWKERLPEDVPFLDLGNMENISYENKELILRLLIVQLEPSHVYNLSSQLAFIMISKYGKALSRVTKLYTFAFCQEYDYEGKIQGYAFLYLDSCMNFLTKVFTDNQRYIDFLCNIYGFPKEKFTPLYQPTEVLDISKREYSEATPLKLLWASRLDKQKHPEIVYEIAKKCKDLPISIDVYGTKVLDDYFNIDKFNQLSNIQYKGIFSNGLKEISDNYDAFIYTSEYDGMPNIILEAIGVGLPIISSNVGGIGDLVEDKKSALLIDQYNDIEAYRSQIEYALNHRKEFNGYAKLAQKEMLKKHNWKTHEKTIKESIN
jgi:glycosyltransferase involved in cell wall biosynthesis